MKTVKIFGSVVSILVAAWGSAAGQGAGPEVVISEFMALNERTLLDKDRQYSDWIEVFNPGASPVNLSGWSLTDRVGAPTKWVFPEVELPAGGFLVVFATGLDRRVANAELHTNFKILGSGEYLALFNPEGVPSVEFKPKFPWQLIDSTYGVGMNLKTKKLVSEGAVASYFVPPTNALGTNWIKADFDDAAWATGPTGLGFDAKATPTYLDLIQTDLRAVLERLASSLYVRIAFQAAEEDLGKSMRLRVRYDDGFIAFLNGVEVARKNLFGTSVSFSSRAAAERPAGDARLYETIQLPSSANRLLVAGRNILAIQALNNLKTGDDLLIVPELETAEIESVARETKLYFSVPTPGGPNAEGFPTLAEEPLFSEVSGTFAQPFDLEMIAPGPGVEIRYTSDGTEPTRGSTLYSAAVTINSTRTVKARSFETGKHPSATVVHTFVFLNPNVVNFSSNLPVMVINTFGKTISEAWTPSHFMLLEPEEDGRTKMTGRASLSSNAALKIRGSSTSGTAKPSWALEIRDSLGDDRAVGMLDLPADSDWILHAPFSFDRALIRNPFIFEMSNQVGRWATHNRFCEVYRAQGGSVSSADYMGVYNFLEKIKQGKDRVDIEDLEPNYDTEPLVGGGYMLKIDRLDPGDQGINAAGQTMGLVYPKEQEISAKQKAWVVKYLNDFLRALNGPRYTDPVLGYHPYVDVDSWIDHHLLNVLAKNVDALRLSAYFYKTRTGKIEFGPIWDFDRSMESTDGRDDDPRTWNGTGDGTPFFTYPWWGRLFSDPEFNRRYKLRWLELRKGAFSNQNMSMVIDDMAAELNEAQARNNTRWISQLGSANFATETNRMKTWLVARGNWIDSQYIFPPDFVTPSGSVEKGFKAVITVPSGEIFYTINGPDPMGANSAPHAEAKPYTAPILVEENSRIRARARLSPTQWTPMSQAVYTTKLLPLVITEIMYNPAGPPENPAGGTEYEFIEILNVGSEPASLAGVRLSERPTFSFSNGTVATLNPGEYAVVVKNLEVFASRYGAEGIKVAGKFDGTISLNNNSQAVVLQGPIEEVLFAVTYQRTWHPTTNAQGYSLVLRDPLSPRETWNDILAWRPSGLAGGSPGREDVIPSRQLPGDMTLDGRLTVSDGIVLLRHLFSGAPISPCDSAEGNTKFFDINGDQTLNATDAIQLLRYLFAAGDAPALGKSCVVISGCAEGCAGG